jgi:hypothetical protein
VLQGGVEIMSNLKSKDDSFTTFGTLADVSSDLLSSIVGGTFSPNFGLDGPGPIEAVRIDDALFHAAATVALKTGLLSLRGRIVGRNGLIVDKIVPHSLVAKHAFSRFASLEHGSALQNWLSAERELLEL